MQDPRFTDAVASLASTIRGMSKDDLYGEHVSQHRRLVRLRRLAIAGLTVLTVSAVGAAVVAVGQRNEARRQAQVALGRQLAAQAETMRAQRAQLLPNSLLMGIESMRAFPSVEADQAIRGALARLPDLVRVLQQPDAVEEVAVDAGNGRIAVATARGLVTLWDADGRAERPRPRRALLVHQSCFRQTARCWRRSTAIRVCACGMAETGRGRNPPVQLKGRTTRVAFSPDGQMLAATSASGVSIWGADTGRQMRLLPLERGATGGQGLAFSTDGRLAAVDWTRACGCGTRAQGASLPQPDMPNASIAALRFSPDGKWLVAGGSTGSLWVWGSGETRPRATFAVRAIRDIVFSDDGALMAASGGDDQATVWETAKWTEVTTVRHAGEITSIALSASGSLLATGGADGTAALWSIANGTRLTSMDHGDRVARVAFMADPVRVVTGSTDGTVRIWQAHSEVEVAALGGGAEESQTTFTSRGAEFLKIAGDSLTIWRERGSSQRLSLPMARRSAALAPNGEWAAVAGVGDVVRIWDARGQGETVSLPHPGQVDWEEYARRVGRFRRDSQAASFQKQMSDTRGTVDLSGFSADGRYLLTTRLDFTARIWEVASGRLIASQPYETVLTAGAFSPDGRFATLVVDGKELRVLGLPDARNASPLAPRTSFR